MTAIIVFILIIIGFNLIPELTKKRFPKTEKLIKRILIYVTVTFVILIILSFSGLKLKGIYSNLIIGLIFILTSLLYFAITKNTTRKIVTIVALIPLILLSAYFQVFNENLGRYKVTEKHNIVISREGFLACGEIIRLTTPKFLIFDKELIYDSNQCLRGIYKIETVEFDEKRAEFLIYHNGDMDSENPYDYEIENKNVW
tara:strand:- start:72 stop:671 length:600 start_codon:yes stop_codon:yes gene_type:complete